MSFDITKLQVTNDMVDTVQPDGGYPDDLAKLDTPEAICAAFGDTNREFPEALWIEPNERRERARMNDELGLWAFNYLDRFTNQSPTHECTCHSLRAVAEACRNRQRRISMGGPEVGVRLPVSAEAYSVWFSCVSIYAEANPGQRGGANVQQVMRIACERGFLPDLIQPRNYGFRHAMQGTCGRGNNNQSSGPWPGWRNGDFLRKPDNWVDDNWKVTSKHFMPLECVYPKNEDEFDCLLLHGYGIGIGRRGHAVPVLGIKYEGNRKLYPYWDSYDRILFDSSAYYRGAFSILTMKSPDDWTKPVGGDVR